MPPAEGPVRVSSVLGDYRDRLARHTFLGGNAFMLRMMSRYRSELGVEATSAELEATARATIRQLEQETATVAVDQAVLRGGTLAFDVVVTNLTGHKFPTGYPSRRAWLHVTVRDREGGIVFESGGVTKAGSIVGNDSDSAAAAFEPHYEEITRSDAVQIYESIMGTPAGAPTTGLLQATQYLKDNRLLPRGFDKRTAAPEIAVVGAGAADADFTGKAIGCATAFQCPHRPRSRSSSDTSRSAFAGRRIWRPTTHRSRDDSSATTTIWRRSRPSWWPARRGAWGREQCQPE